MNLTYSKDLKTVDAGAASDLLCPRCGADNLHHIGVTVFDRKEDAGATVKTVVRGGRAETDVVRNNATGNPSARRDGITVDFWCEQCGEDKIIELRIAQHKGSTEVSWLFSERD